MHGAKLIYLTPASKALKSVHTYVKVLLAAVILLAGTVIEGV
jgi:hypothetical protein